MTRTRKNVVLLFSKVPEAGLVKTRLTTLKDGIYAPEVASGLYHCMLFDVVEIIMAALTDMEDAACRTTDATVCDSESASARAEASRVPRFCAR